MSEFLPPPELIQRRLVTLVTLLHREYASHIKARTQPPDDGLNLTEMRQWATQIESLMRSTPKKDPLLL
jgi:hypothetical protein